MCRSIWIPYRSTKNPQCIVALVYEENFWVVFFDAKVYGKCDPHSLVVRTVRFNPWLNPSGCSWGYGHNHGKKCVSWDVYKFPYKSHNIPTIQLIQWGTVDIHSSTSWMSIVSGVYNGIYIVCLYIYTIYLYHLYHYL